MTRINCIPPTELTGPHLVAEYRELPRVVALANAAWPRRGAYARSIPSRYVLGAGHVLFFYDKLGWLRERFSELVDEMHRRGYRTSYTALPPVRVGVEWCKEWSPDATALADNRARIAERLRSARNRRAQ